MLTDLVRFNTYRPLSESSRREVGGGSGTAAAVAVLWHQKNSCADKRSEWMAWNFGCCMRGGGCTSLCVDGHRCRLVVACWQTRGRLSLWQYHCNWRGTHQKNPRAPWIWISGQFEPCASRSCKVRSWFQKQEQEGPADGHVETELASHYFVTMMRDRVNALPPEAVWNMDQTPIFTLTTVAVLWLAKVSDPSMSFLQWHPPIVLHLMQPWPCPDTSLCPSQSSRAIQTVQLTPKSYQHSRRTVSGPCRRKLGAMRGPWRCGSRVLLFRRQQELSVIPWCDSSSSAWCVQGSSDGQNCRVDSVAWRGGHAHPCRMHLPLSACQKCWHQQASQEEHGWCMGGVDAWGEYCKQCNTNT